MVACRVHKQTRFTQSKLSQKKGGQSLVDLHMAPPVTTVTQTRWVLGSAQRQTEAQVVLSRTRYRCRLLVTPIKTWTRPKRERRTMTQANGHAGCRAREDTTEPRQNNGGHGYSFGKAHASQTHLRPTPSQGTHREPKLHTNTSNLFLSSYVSLKTLKHESLDNKFLLGLN